MKMILVIIGVLLFAGIAVYAGNEYQQRMEEFTHVEDVKTPGITSEVREKYYGKYRQRIFVAIEITNHTNVAVNCIFLHLYEFAGDQQQLFTIKPKDSHLYVVPEQQRVPGNFVWNCNKTE